MTEGLCDDCEAPCPILKPFHGYYLCPECYRKAKKLEDDYLDEEEPNE